MSASLRPIVTKDFIGFLQSLKAMSLQDLKTAHYSLLPNSYLPNISDYFSHINVSYVTWNGR
jgi:hypothetical protein